MSLLRLAATAGVMAVAAALLVTLTPDVPDPALLGADPQAFVDAAGPDTLLLAVAALLAWVAWGWGALGLLLTALAAVPGIVGLVARGATRLLLPADVRRGAAFALGVGLAVGTPVLSACSPAPAQSAAVASLPQAAPVPDWPAAPGGDTPAAVGPVPAGGTASPDSPDPVPEWPAGVHVVVRGDSLWHIAAADLRARTGSEPTAADTARAVAAWWAVNTEVIGPEPDLLLPGQVLHAPASPSVPVESETQE